MLILLFSQISLVTINGDHRIHVPFPKSGFVTRNYLYTIIILLRTLQNSVCSSHVAFAETILSHLSKQKPQTINQSHNVLSFCRFKLTLRRRNIRGIKKPERFTSKKHRSTMNNKWQYPRKLKSTASKRPSSNIGSDEQATCVVRVTNFPAKCPTANNRSCRCHCSLCRYRDQLKQIMKKININSET